MTCFDIAGAPETIDESCGIKIKPITPNQTIDELSRDVHEQTLMSGYHHFRCPQARFDSQELELDGETLRVSKCLLHIGIDPVDKGLDDRLTPWMVVIQLFLEVAAEHVESCSDVALELSRA